jgi:hypothetical protein
MGTGREFDHPTPSSADFKNQWSYTSTPPSWRGQVQIYHFTFTVWYEINMYILYAGYVKID